MKTYENKIFTPDDFALDSGAEYASCEFRGVSFFKSKMNGTKFTDCTFSSCNLAVVNFIDAALNDVRFRDCKMTGADFSKCQTFLFSVSFANCDLGMAIFHKNDLKNTTFDACNMRESSFVEVNLHGAVFANCDLEKATFDHANLERADFRSARNYSINPNTNRLKKTIFSMPDAIGLVDHLDIIIK